MTQAPLAGRETTHRTLSAQHTSLTVDAADGGDDAHRLMELFSGRTDAYGTHGEPVFDSSKGKWSIQGTARTVKGPVTEALWDAHLRGERPLGIIPIMPDNRCQWGSIDVDLYDDPASILDLVQRVEDKRLLLVPARSKSGGLHLFLFLREPAPAGEVRAALERLARRLGLRDDTEIFPKQTKVEPGKLGNWIIMPYFGSTYGDRLRSQAGLRMTGCELTLPEFLRFAEPRRLSSEQLAKLVDQQEPETGHAVRTSPDKGGRYAADRLRKFADQLSDALSGTRNNLLNASAYAMGRVIARGWIARDEVERALREAALASGLPSSEIDDVLRRAIKDGTRNPHPELDERDALVTEDSAALAFAERHGGALRYDHDADAWYVWSGTHWARERTDLAFSWARDLAREISRTEKARVRHVASKAGFASAVEKFARADRTFAVTQEVWDRDHFLLGTPGGTVELRTGQLRAAQPDDRITKITKTAPAETAECPLWQKFLFDATMGNQQLIRFLQALCGYALTGETREHILVFIYGPGGNGKSLFINTIASIMGDYAAAAAMETFTAAHYDRHPADLAMLRGARLVTAAETEEGRAWTETRIKQMSGGDPITARFMRCDFFTYIPTFQLVIVGNHQPNLKTVTDATRRRFAIVPFVHEPATPDRDLQEKLRAEWPGILRWMIDGCLDWQANGLVRPDVVLDATESYFAEQDMFGQWLDECCESAPTGVQRKSETSQALFESWTIFAQAAGEEPGSRRAFAERMAQRGRVSSKDGRGNRVYLGIRLKKGAPDPSPF
jgi:putative DNA primase/helicase